MLNSHLHTTEQYSTVFVDAVQIAKDKHINLFHLWKFIYLFILKKESNGICSGSRSHFAALIPLQHCDSTGNHPQICF